MCFDVPKIGLPDVIDIIIIDKSNYQLKWSAQIDVHITFSFHFQMVYSWIVFIIFSVSVKVECLGKSLQHNSIDTHIRIHAHT